MLMQTKELSENCAKQYIASIINARQFWGWILIILPVELFTKRNMFSRIPVLDFKGRMYCNI
jgi:hypothetical protein